VSALVIAYVGVLGVLGVYGGHRVWLIVRAWGARDPEPCEVEGEGPVITVQLPVFNEACVAGRLIDAACGLDWPAERLEIQVLDDSTDETTEICAERVGYWRARGVDVVHLRRGGRDGFKAGALAHGLERARGELVLVLDADFVVPPDLLRRLAGRFADPGLGMVQVRWEHLNRGAGALTRVQALLLDGHFAVEQPARASSGRFFNFNGTAGLWRRAAIDDAGGWSAGTLTEDLDLSYRALLRGWRFAYLRGAAAPAELPADMNAFKSQQYRWAKGSMQVARALLPRVLAAPLPVRVKLEAVFHLTQNLPYLLTLVLVLVAGPALALGAVDTGPWLALALGAGTTGVLAAYCAASQRLLGRAWWRALADLPALIAVTAGICASQSRAVIEGVLGHRSEFVRTPKQGAGAGRPPQRRYRGRRDPVIAAELALAAYSAAAAVVAAADGRLAALPILATFTLGFAWVGAASLLRR